MDSPNFFPIGNPLKNKTMAQAQIGVIGLGVMGANLARNFSNHKIPTVVYNRTTEIMENLVAEHGNNYLFGEKELNEFVARLQTPRRILIMVKAGAPVDNVIEGLLPHLDKDDILIDGGNSNFRDTIQREKSLSKKGIHFVGMGVSGGEEGALNGPSIMPGGSLHAWKSLKPLLESIAARDFDNNPCVTHVGENGAGHYVKMVHNGIEYAVMQLMAEGYDMVRSIYKLPANEISSIFKTYNQGKLKSFLFEIAITVLAKKDDRAEGFLVDQILDKAGQKGTGQWTSIDGFERGVAISTINAAVTARSLSAEKARRTRLAGLAPIRVTSKGQIPLEEFTARLESALYASMLISYAQGYDLIQHASDEHAWNINLSEISRIWEGGCIIRADLLNFLHKAYASSQKPDHLFDIPEIQFALAESLADLRELTAYALQNQVPAHAMTTAITYADALTQANGSANFIQGLRDFFGAHTYERTNSEGSFHTNWTS